MPNATITTYLKDADFIKFLNRKDEISKKIRALVKREVNGVGGK